MGVGFLENSFTAVNTSGDDDLAGFGAGVGEWTGTITNIYFYNTSNNLNNCSGSDIISGCTAINDLTYFYFSSWLDLF